MIGAGADDADHGRDRPGWPGCFAATGKDATLTGHRTELWAIAYDLISHNPLTGYGYGAFWVNERFAPSISRSSRAGNRTRPRFPISRRCRRRQSGDRHWRHPRLILTTLSRAFRAWRPAASAMSVCWLVLSILPSMSGWSSCSSYRQHESCPLDDHAGRQPWQNGAAAGPRPQARTAPGIPCPGTPLAGGGGRQARNRRPRHDPERQKHWRNDDCPARPCLRSIWPAPSALPAPALPAMAGDRRDHAGADGAGAGLCLSSPPPPIPPAPRWWLIRASRTRPSGPEARRR